MKVRNFLIAITILFSYTFLPAQKKSIEIGGKIITEFEDWKRYEPGVGLQVVRRISKHSGVESGLFYKIQANNYYYFDMANNLYRRESREKTLWLPLLYRFDSKAINFTAGPILKYFMGWKDVSKAPYTSNLAPYYQQTFELIASLSISKNIFLNPTLILEPEIRGSAFVPDGGGGVSVNIALRKKIF